MEFSNNGKNFIKAGWSIDLRKCIHEIPGSMIYCAYVIDNPMRIASDWKDSFGAYNLTMDKEGTIESDMFFGLNIEEGEQLLVRYCQEQTLRQVDEKKHEYDMKQHYREKERMEHERELKRMEYVHDLKRMEHEREMKMLELQILEKQLTLRKVNISS